MCKVICSSRFHMPIEQHTHEVRPSLCFRGGRMGRSWCSLTSSSLGARNPFICLFHLSQMASNCGEVCGLSSSKPLLLTQPTNPSLLHLGSSSVFYVMIACVSMSPTRLWLPSGCFVPSLFAYIELWCCNLTQASFEVEILLPQLSKCWDYSLFICE